ncbi:hypothetical protein [Bacillus sp. UMB0893]|uniref:hypothetical protein n=1 Tax=Bacillus sp. UMB0893 TaxID=2066053 RepID=UPI000C7640F5|nr:hypothetical protein [Bacillus sp. UMB0893]PLR65987.1 hypothetical protein CYJ36_20145 [Bacillus sp. UMB0893]
MRKNRCTFILLVLLMLGSASQVYADVYVKGYFRNNGTYVQPHYRSNPDGLFSNNFSTFGNTNPYTGQLGTKRYPEYNYNSSSYSNYLNPFSYWDTENNFNDSSDFTVVDYSVDDATVTNNSTDDEIATYSFKQSEDINVAENYITTFDTTEEIEAKTLIVQYFNYVNTRAYRLAYECWGTDWQSRQPYGAFEDGYVDVINQIKYINATSNEKGITLEVTIIAKEGWEQIKHQYHIVYNVQKIEDKWKIINGKGKLVW